MTGTDVSAQQLQRMVREIATEQKAAEQYIESGGADIPHLEAPASLNKKRVSKHRKAVEDALRKYGEKRMLEDLPRYSQELGMDQRTLERHLKAILSA